MQESIVNSLRSNFGGGWGNLSMRRKLIIGLTAAVIVAAIISVALWSSRPDYVVLFSGLAPEDVGAIQDELYAARVPFKQSADGASILVPSSQVYPMRLRLVNKGLPEVGAVGFEGFDKADFGMTDFVQKLKYQRALQVELARTISSIKEVLSARVHIAIPRQTVFTDREQPTKASAVLSLRPGARLQKAQISGIVHLISSAVPGLQDNNVTVLDTSGRMLSSPADTAFLDSSQLEYQHTLEKSLETQVQNMLDVVLGPNKAVVQVAAEVDFDLVQTTSETYAPEAVVKSETTTTYTSKGVQPVSGIPGVTSGVTPNNQSGGVLPEFNKSDTQTEYNVGKSVSTNTKRPGSVKKLSVAVVVDNKMVNGASVPRTQQELADIESLVKNAVGVDMARGDPQIEVRNIPFDTSLQQEAQDAEKILKRERMREIITKAVIGLVAVLFLFFALRTVSKMRKSSPTPALPQGLSEMSQLEGLLAENAKEMQTELSAPEPGQALESAPAEVTDRDRIVAMVDEDLDRVVQTIREWMLQE